MFKKVLFLLLVVTASFSFAKNVSKQDCEQKGEGFIYAGNECINYAMFEGDDNDKLIVIVHGTWDEGSNVLGRYAPFAENLNMSSDISTIAVALPGYSDSSLNKLKSIGSKEYNHQAATKEYVQFLEKLVIALKDKYESKEITIVGHSAGAMMSGSLAGLNPELLKNVVLVAGRYERPDYANEKHLLANDVLTKMNKESKFIMIYGTKDEISKPSVTKDFYKKMKAQGLDVQLVEVKDAGHIDLDMTDKSIEAISSLFEE
ncbi:alpha/beta hydrolase [Poseidonibacter parvus]|uniref:Alpha/beta hydrolase n=1 Tax=Poseidonibacter parvus TaxID=1850254 RepID=A0A1P8KPF3_9BACT|nr:alpha/beta fold hydrolase [Poseidonibacter parvus]APW66428.1 alpha/beta hydrolase [Poseidonibacter parvus]